jgi:hypothetical protein
MGEALVGVGVKITQNTSFHRDSLIHTIHNTSAEQVGVQICPNNTKDPCLFICIFMTFYTPLVPNLVFYSSLHGIFFLLKPTLWLMVYVLSNCHLRTLTMRILFIGHLLFGYFISRPRRSSPCSPTTT